MLKSSRLTGLADPVLTSTHGAIAARTGGPAPIGVAQSYMADTATTAHVRTIGLTASTGLGRSSKRARMPTTKRAAVQPDSRSAGPGRGLSSLTRHAAVGQHQNTAVC